MGKLAKISPSKANRVNKSFNILINRQLLLPLSKNRTIKNALISRFLKGWKRLRKSATAALGILEWVPSTTMLLITIICHSSILTTVIHLFIHIFTDLCLLQWACTILLITICTALLQVLMPRLLHNSQLHLQITPKTSLVTAWSVCRVFLCICSINSAKGITGMKLTAILDLLSMIPTEAPTISARELPITVLHAVESSKTVVETTLAPIVTKISSNKSSRQRWREWINSNQVALRTAIRDFKVSLKDVLEHKIQLIVSPEAQLPIDQTIWSPRSPCILSNRTALAS